MSEWRNVKLENIIDITSSKRVFYSEYVDAGIPFYRSKEIINLFNKNDIQTELFIAEERFSEIKEKFGVPEEGDILLTSVGTLGIPYIVRQNDRFYFKDGNLTWFKKQKENSSILSEYLFYWLISPIGKQSLDEISIGSTQAALTITGLKSLEINLPSLPEQKAIADVLSALDDKIDLLQRQNETLEKMAETLFRQWFIEEAQEDWEEVTVGSFGRVICGKTPSKKNAKYYGDDIPFLKIPDMHGSLYVFKTADNLSLAGSDSQIKKLVPKNSICVSCIATVGLVCIPDIDMQTNQQINSIALNDSRYLYFLFLTMKNMYEELQNLASGGTATLNLNTGNFEKIMVLRPDLDSLDYFNELATPKFEKIRINTKQIQTLQNLRDTLLPKLMSGEVRVQLDQ